MMSKEDALRRLAILKKKPSASGKADEYLEQELENATAVFLQYTARENDPGQYVDIIIVDLTTISINQAGAEGSSSASEGGISRTWSSIPEELKLRMNRWRLPIGYDAVKA